jgi:hypothetical protein
MPGTSQRGKEDGSDTTGADRPDGEAGRPIGRRDVRHD